MSHRILIIDDEDDIREVAALSLETVAGWEVAMASSGAQGLARAAEYRPDAILLDRRYQSANTARIAYMDGNGCGLA